MGLIGDLSTAFRRNCEAISTDCRSVLGLRAFDRLSADQLATHLNAQVLTPDQLPSLESKYLKALENNSKWSAAVINQFPLKIVHNPSHAPTRRESDLMHEFAHVILNHRMVGFDSLTNLPLREPQDEKEAVYLGSCLQIPHRGLLWATQRGMCLAQISQHFNASEEMVLFRSNVFGLRKTVEQS